MFFLPAYIPTSSIVSDKPSIECVSSVTTLKSYSFYPDEIINFDLGNTFDFSKYLSIIGTTLVSNSIKMRISEEPYLEEFIDNLDFIVKNPNVKKVNLKVNIKLIRNINHKVVV